MNTLTRLTHDIALYTNSIVLALSMVERRNIHTPCPPSLIHARRHAPFSVGRRHTTYSLSTHAPRMPTLTPHLPAPSPKGPNVSSHHVSKCACYAIMYRLLTSLRLSFFMHPYPIAPPHLSLKTPRSRRRSPASTVVHETPRTPIRPPPPSHRLYTLPPKCGRHGITAVRCPLFSLSPQA